MIQIIENMTQSFYKTTESITINWPDLITRLMMLEGLKMWWTLTPPMFAKTNAENNSEPDQYYPFMYARVLWLRVGIFHARRYCVATAFLASEDLRIGRDIPASDLQVEADSSLSSLLVLLIAAIMTYHCRFYYYLSQRSWLCTSLPPV